MHLKTLLPRAVAAAFGLIAGAAAASADPGVTADKIVFGEAAAFEGPAAALGIGMREGINAAFAEVNKAGGVNGRKLELISVDDSYEPNKSIEATKKLINDDKVFALLGPVGTPTSSATQPIATEAGVPFIAPFTGAEFLRNPFKPNVVNVRASYFQETEEMVERLTKDRGIKNIAILYQDDGYGRAGLAGVQKALEKRGMKLVSEGSYERNTVAVKAALLNIRKGNPEAVIMVGAYKPCAEFIKLARQVKLDAVFMNISFVGPNALAKELGDAGKGVVVTQVVPFPEDTSLPLVAAYQAALKGVDANAQPGFVSLEGYMAGRLVIEALKKVPGEPTRKALLDAVLSNSFDLGGITLAYGKDDNQGMDQVFLTVIQGEGKFKPVKALEQAGG
ncbi:MAG TPA: ABC transporter substrate-binding protein [Hyphomicrobiales bacterium]|jgi:ABC-type branched-subunit amino acid transport system substrate-binding protein